MGNALCPGCVREALTCCFPPDLSLLCSCRKISSADKAILELKVLRRKLMVRCKALERKIVIDREVYKKLDGHSTRANLVLRHIEALEKAIAQCQTYSYHVDSILLDMGEQETLIQVVDALKDGKRATERLNALLSIEDVEELLQDGMLASEKQKSLEVCLFQNLDNGSDVSETPCRAPDEEVFPPSVPVHQEQEPGDKDTRVLVN